MTRQSNISRVFVITALAASAGLAHADDPKPTPSAPPDLPVAPPDMPGAPSTESAARPADAKPVNANGMVEVPVTADDQNVNRAAIDDPAHQRADAAALAKRAAAARPPIVVTGSAYGAGIGYDDHPFRRGGFEGQLRADVWQGLEWGAHAAYTIDAVDANESSAAAGASSPYKATAYHDVDLGGSLDLGFKIPLWAYGELHLMGGPTDYGTAVGVYGGVGTRYKQVDFELGVGGVWASGDSNATFAAHAQRRAILPWLGIGATVLVTHDNPSNMYITSGGWHLAAGPEVTVGPWRKLAITADALFGARSFTLMNRGEVVENVPDVQHTTVRLFVWYTISAKLRAYVGAQVRTATAAVSTDMTQDYTLVSGFGGAIYNF